MSSRMGQSALFRARPVLRLRPRHRGGSLVPVGALFSIRVLKGIGTTLLLRCLMTMLVRATGVKSCPPDMSGHRPDTIPDTKNIVMKRKTGIGRPDILAGHGFNILCLRHLGPIFGGLRYPLCPDMHDCARRNVHNGARSIPRAAMRRRGWNHVFEAWLTTTRAGSPRFPAAIRTVNATHDRYNRPFRLPGDSTPSTHTILRKALR